MLAYVVQPGNTLSGIADAFGSSVETITVANGIPNPDLIFPGMILGVPSSPDHTGAPHGRKEKIAQDEKLVVELVALLEEKSRAWRAPREWRRVRGSMGFDAEEISGGRARISHALSLRALEGRW